MTDTADEILEQVQGYREEGVVAVGPVNEPWQTVAEAHWWERGVFPKLAALRRAGVV